MDEKSEDMSEESKKNHIAYYRSLSRVILDMEMEKTQETEPAVLRHLEDRISAVRKDQTRIKGMFPDVRAEEWE